MSWEGGQTTARRRVSPPVLVIGVVLAVLAVGLLVRQDPEAPQFTVDPAPSPQPDPTRTLEQEPPPRPAPAPSVGEVERGQIEPLLLGRTGLTLHTLDQAGRLARIDLDTGELVEVGLFRATSEQPQQDAVHVMALDQPPVPLGPAAAVLPSATPGRVWLLEQPAGFPATGNRVREVTYDGTVTVDGSLPPGVSARTAVPGGLLVEAAGTLVDLATGTRRSLSAIPQQSDVLVWDPSGRWLLAPSGGTVRAWNLRSDATVILELGLDRVAAIAVR